MLMQCVAFLTDVRFLQWHDMQTTIGKLTLPTPPPGQTLGGQQMTTPTTNTNFTSALDKQEWLWWIMIQQRVTFKLI